MPPAAAHAQPPLLSPSPREAHWPQVMNLLGHILTTHCPQVTLGLTPGVAYSMGLDKRILMWTHHYGPTQSTCTILTILCAPSIHPSTPQEFHTNLKWNSHTWLVATILDSLELDAAKNTAAALTAVKLSAWTWLKHSFAPANNQPWDVSTCRSSIFHFSASTHTRTCTHTPSTSLTGSNQGLEI